MIVDRIKHGYRGPNITTGVVPLVITLIQGIWTIATAAVLYHD